MAPGFADSKEVRELAVSKKAEIALKTGAKSSNNQPNSSPFIPDAFSPSMTEASASQTTSPREVSA